jgi:hypothetical protein
MRTFVCTACGRYTSRYADRCPFCRQRNLVLLDSYNASALQENRVGRSIESGGSGPLSSIVLVAALAGGMAAVLCIWIHPNADSAKQPDAKLISSTAKAASGENH